jgi:HlyD family secretion protein
VGVGRRAEVVVEAQPDRVLPARVKRVDAVAKRRTQRSPTQYFGVVLTLDRSDAARPDRSARPAGPDRGGKPGQRVRARLFLHEEQALVLPRPALFERDGRWIAYRRDQTGFSPVPVKIGVSTAGLCTISSGLKENDTVALRDPGRSPADLLSRPEGASPAAR